MLNGLISRQGGPERLLRLIADELPNFNDVNVATAFSKLSKICGFWLFPRDIAADDRFRRLMLLAGEMCGNGLLLVGRCRFTLRDPSYNRLAISA
jgi:hypothetical protein